MMKQILVAVLVAASVPAFAANQSEAFPACVRVMQAYQKELGPRSVAVDPAADCKRNTLSVEVLNCMESRMKQGETFMSANQQCKPQ